MNGRSDDRAVPCPCCGHLTLTYRPGEAEGAELCPVCFWEGDAGQLRWPMSADGANGISLMDAQRAYQRIGAMSPDFRSKTRRPRANEPLDKGWRPFDPDRDWTGPALDSGRWPGNPEALYYWRPTYWNGDPEALPAPAREATGGDRLVEHLRREVPETAAVIEALEHQYQYPPPMAVCTEVADLAIRAYRGGEADLALRIVTALDPGLDEASELYSHNSVAIGFFENDDWYDPDLQPWIDQWPVRIRTEVRRQLAHAAQSGAERERLVAEWRDLLANSHGRPVQEIEERLGAFNPDGVGHPGSDMQVVLAARVVSDQHWFYKHPLAAFVLAWRYRAVQHPLRTLRWLRRPRFAG